MGSSNNSVRVASKRVCREVIKSPYPDSQTIQAKAQKAQEDVMWATYRAEQARIAHEGQSEEVSPVMHGEGISEGSSFVYQDESNSEEDSVNSCHDMKKTISQSVGYSRFDSATDRNLHLYPSEKEGQTTKDRRHHHTAKVSDRDKIHGKLKGRSHRKLKKDGLPIHTDDIVLPDDVDDNGDNDVNVDEDVE